MPGGADGVGELHTSVADRPTQCRGRRLTRLSSIANVELSRLQYVTGVWILDVPASDDLRGSARIGIELRDIEHGLVIEGGGAIPRKRRHVSPQQGGEILTEDAGEVLVQRLGPSIDV